MNNRGIIIAIIIIAILLIGGWLLMRNGGVDTELENENESTIPQDNSTTTPGNTATSTATSTSSGSGTNIGVDVGVTAGVTKTVTYSANGFSPGETKIKVGDTIRFTNQSSGDMRVASAPHPTHTAYPEFDQKANGNTYEFTFTKAGTWAFHNHAKPSHFGRIVVE